MKSLFVTVLVLFLSFSSLAQTLQVDEDIKELELQIEQLKYFKKLLTDRSCTIYFSNTAVRVLPDALRSEGIRLAVGDQFPSEYLAFYIMPKALDLLTYIAMTYDDATKTKNSAYFGLTVIQGPNDKEPTGLRLELKEPTYKPQAGKGTAMQWIYSGVVAHISLPLGTGTLYSGTLPSGKLVRFVCN